MLKLLDRDLGHHGILNRQLYFMLVDVIRHLFLGINWTERITVIW